MRSSNGLVNTAELVLETILFVLDNGKMSANKLAHMLETTGFDWSCIRLTIDGGGQIKHAFPLTPRNYLEFSAEDLRDGCIRGYVNAVANAKRAIDCQVDTSIAALGYEPGKLRVQLGKDLCTMIETQASDKKAPFSFKFLESIGAFTPNIVGRVRAFRHDVEHRYNRISRKRAADALEIATLFVHATERIALDFTESFSFGSGEIDESHGQTLKHEFYAQLRCRAPTPHAEVVIWSRPKPNYTTSPRVKVLPGHTAYYWLLQIALSIACLDHKMIQPHIRNLVSATKARTDPKQIKVVGYFFDYAD